MLRAPRTSTRDAAAVYPFCVALPFVVVHRRQPPKDEVVAAPSEAAATTLVIEPLPRTPPPSRWWCPPRLAPTRRSRKTTRRPADRTGTSDRPLGASRRRLSATQRHHRTRLPPTGHSAPPRRRPSATQRHSLVLRPPLGVFGRPSCVARAATLGVRSSSCWRSTRLRASCRSSADTAADVAEGRRLRHPCPERNLATSLRRRHPCPERDLAAPCTVYHLHLSATRC